MSPTADPNKHSHKHREKDPDRFIPEGEDTQKEMEIEQEIEQEPCGCGCGEEGESDTPPDASFDHILQDFYFRALLFLGLLVPPGEEKPMEPNLPMAKYNIDLLEILQNKTANNLSEEETGLLEDILQELHLAYAHCAGYNGNE